MEATDLTVIVGDNDCGKSNVLRALNLFFNGETNPGIHFSFPDDYNRFAEVRAKRAPEIEVQLDLELPPPIVRTMVILSAGASDGEQTDFKKAMNTSAYDVSRISVAAGFTR